MRDPATRMLCTRCYRVGVPDTWIPGSDRLELLGWCCLGLPGLLYCAWRHLQRAKTCAQCASPDLVREARASRRRDGDEAARPAAAVVRSRGPSPWPPALATPRARLRRGWGVALAALGVLLASGVEWLPGAPTARPLAQASLWIGTSALLLQLAVRHLATAPWAAWDAQGRPLPVELLPR